MLATRLSVVAFCRNMKLHLAEDLNNEVRHPLDVEILREWMGNDDPASKLGYNKT